MLPASFPDFRHFAAGEVNDPPAKLSTEGVLACPDVPSYMENLATFIIYVRTPEFHLTDCVELQGLEATILPDPAPYGAWQYV